MKHRIICVILVLLMLVPSIVSCKKKDEGSEQQSSESTTVQEKKYLDNLPETDKYNGVVINALVVQQDAASNYISENPGSEASILSKEIYQSTATLNDRFGITMSYTEMDGYSSGYQAFMNQITATTAAGGDSAYDIIIPAYWYGMILANEFYYDLNTVDNIDFSQPYWCAGFNDNTEINGVRYAAVGDFILGSVGASYMVAFNSKMVSDYKLTTPYAFYDNNMWTIENMFLLRTAVSYDDPTNDENDRYGVVMSRQTLDGFYTSSNLHIIENNNGEFKITKYSEKAEDLYQRLYGYMHKDKGVYYATSVDAAVDMFCKEKSLFVCTSLACAQKMRQMENDYSFIVYPKYDSDQDDYVTGTSGCGIMAIPKTARDPEMSGLVMEALCSQFRKNVIPTYIDIILEGHTARDTRSIEMIEKAIDTRYFDFGFVNHNAIGNIANFGIQMESMYETMSSWYYGSEQKYQKALEDYINNYVK
ncbi:MAG: hypothetical protein ACI3XQ_09380 [Eubacteriales bacterium]